MQNSHTKSFTDSEIKKYINNNFVCRDSINANQNNAFPSKVTVDDMAQEIKNDDDFNKLKYNDDESASYIVDFFDKEKEAYDQIMEIGNKHYKDGNYYLASSLYHEAATILMTLEVCHMALLSASKIPGYKIEYNKYKQFKEKLEQKNQELQAKGESTIDYGDLFNKIQLLEENTTSTNSILSQKIEIKEYTGECKYIKDVEDDIKSLKDNEIKKIDEYQKCVPSEENQNKIKESQKKLKRITDADADLEYVKKIKKQLSEEKNKAIEQSKAIVDSYDDNCPALKLHFWEQLFRNIPSLGVIDSMKGLNEELYSKKIRQIEDNLKSREHGQAKKNIEDLKKSELSYTKSQLQMIQILESKCQAQEYIKQLEIYFQLGQYKNITKTIRLAEESKVIFSNPEKARIKYLKEKCCTEEANEYIKQLEIYFQLGQYENITATIRLAEESKVIFSKPEKARIEYLKAKCCTEKAKEYMERLENYFELGQYENIKETIRLAEKSEAIFSNPEEERIKYLKEKCCIKKAQEYIEQLEHYFELGQYENIKETIRSAEESKVMFSSSEKVKINYFLKATNNLDSSSVDLSQLPYITPKMSIVDGIQNLKVAQPETLKKTSKTEGYVDFQVIRSHILSRSGGETGFNDYNAQKKMTERGLDTSQPGPSGLGSSQQGPSELGSSQQGPSGLNDLKKWASQFTKSPGSSNSKTGEKKIEDTKINDEKIKRPTLHDPNTEDPFNPDHRRGTKRKNDAVMGMYAQ